MFFQVNRKELGLMSLLYKYYSDESQYALNNIENGLISFIIFSLHFLRSVILFTWNTAIING